MGDTYYRQCVLVSQGETGERQLVTWIPEKADGVVLAPGVTLEVRDFRTGEAVQGRFTVRSVGELREPEARVKQRAHRWTRWREATDS